MIASTSNFDTRNVRDIVKCRCPKCGRIHKQRMRWIGTSKHATAYCHVCKLIAFGFKGSWRETDLNK